MPALSSRECARRSMETVVPPSSLVTLVRPSDGIPVRGSAGVSCSQLALMRCACASIKVGRANNAAAAAPRSFAIFFASTSGSTAIVQLSYGFVLAQYTFSQVQCRKRKPRRQLPAGSSADPARLEVPYAERDREHPRTGAVRRDRHVATLEEHVLAADVEVGAETEIEAELVAPRLTVRIGEAITTNLEVTAVASGRR